MNEKGFGVMSIKKDVIEEIKTKAKEAGKPISVLLSDAVKQVYSNKEVKDCSNDIATAMKEYSNTVATDIKELKEAFYSNNVATGKGGGLSKQDLDNSLLGLVSDSDMKMREMLKEVVEKFGSG